MVVIAGAELFTGNNMIVMAWASGRVTTHALLTNWAIAYVGNCFGALATAAIMFLTTQYSSAAARSALTALNIAESKSALPFVPALTLGIMCNALVCLAVWMCYAARTTSIALSRLSRRLLRLWQADSSIRIANVYFIPYRIIHQSLGARLILGSHQKLARRNSTNLTWGNFIVLKSDSGHDRKHDRRVRDGCGSLLVCLSAQEAGATGFERPQPRGAMEWGTVMVSQESASHPAALWFFAFRWLATQSQGRQLAEAAMGNTPGSPKRPHIYRPRRARKRHV